MASGAADAATPTDGKGMNGASPAMQCANVYAVNVYAAHDGAETRADVGAARGRRARQTDTIPSHASAPCGTLRRRPTRAPVTEAI